MKLKLIQVLMYSLAPMVLCAQQTAPQDTIPYDLHPQHDKTDIYAIPLDSSEQEDEEEEEELEEIEKEQAKKN